MYPYPTVLSIQLHVLHELLQMVFHQVFTIDNNRSVVTSYTPDISSTLKRFVDQF